MKIINYIPNDPHLESITHELPKEPISKDMFLDLLRETRKSSKELLEVGKQFCEFIKSR